VRSRRSVRGLTLVEVLIVVALIALLVGGAAFGPGLLRASRVKAAATLLVSAVRLAQTRANTAGHVVRLAMDLDHGRVALEEAEIAAFSRQKGAVAGGAEPIDDAEKKAKSETDKIFDGPRAARTPFRLIKVLTDPADPNQGRELGAGVQIASVETDHDEEPTTEGRAYVYVWPGGMTERAAIRLKRSDNSESELTVLISALTGRASIQRGKGDFPPPREDPDGEGFGPKVEE
jgi:general secretion pathway protein H